MLAQHPEERGGPAWLACARSPAVTLEEKIVNHADNFVMRKDRLIREALRSFEKKIRQGL